MKRTHIQADGDVAAEELFQFVDETQWMDRHAVASCCFVAQQPALST